MKWTNLIKALEEAADFMEYAALSKMPNNWELKKNISFDVNIGNMLYEIEFKAPEYWKWADKGRRPGKMPPIDVIKEWIEVRRIVPRPNSDGKTPSENSLAYLIARKIGREGTKGVYFLEYAVNSTEDAFYNRVAQAIEEDIKIELDSILSGIA